MHADQGVLTGKGTRHDRPVPAKGNKHMPPAFPELIIYLRKPAFIDRLVPGSYPRKITDPVAPPVRHPPRRFVINIELSEATLAGKRRQTCHERWIILGDDSLIRGDVDHAMVAGDDHRHLRR